MGDHEKKLRRGVPVDPDRHRKALRELAEEPGGDVQRLKQLARIARHGGVRFIPPEGDTPQD
jgi:hypothetical protein